uniref:Uncharacterized protein n=1 Tax=Biomphalaria glabrata TaxID=6526 RepID=A0A2C9KFV7_BIOGL
MKKTTYFSIIGEVSKMTKEKGLHPTSPIHVHADDTHVHVKKGKKKTTLAKSSSNSRLQKATASSRARARSVSPPSKSGPWVPAPGKATRGGRISWQVSLFNATITLLV